MPGSKFVGTKGIEPTAEAIANTAASWLGWDSAYWLQVGAEEMAEASLQKIPPPRTEYKDNRTADERARDEQRWKEETETRDRERKSLAQARLAMVAD
jgi:hypothetical protein